MFRAISLISGFVQVILRLLRLEDVRTATVARPDETMQPQSDSFLDVQALPAPGSKKSLHENKLHERREDPGQ